MVGLLTRPCAIVKCRPYVTDYLHVFKGVSGCMYLEFMVILVYCNMMLYASHMELFSVNITRTESPVILFSLLSCVSYTCHCPLRPAAQTSRSNSTRQCRRGASTVTRQQFSLHTSHPTRRRDGGHRQKKPAARVTASNLSLPAMIHRRSPSATPRAPGFFFFTVTGVHIAASPA
jgi:hypothetical protein